MPETLQPLQFVKLRTHFVTNLLCVSDGGLVPSKAL